MDKPPLGVMPKKFWDERRLIDLGNAIGRYTEAGMEFPDEWLEEYQTLFEQLDLDNDRH